VIVLRDYQQQLIADIRERFRSLDRTVLVQLATGGGKTVTSAFMVSGAVARARRCLWVVHRREIIMQASKTFWNMDIEHSLIMGGSVSDPRAAVQIGSIQTVARRLDKIGEIDLIIFDECHHMASAQYQALYDRFPRAQVIGLTATPWRLDGRGLGGWFDTMVQGPSVSDLMESGALSDYKLFAPSTPDVSKVEKQGGDFKSSDLSKVMNKATITGDAVSHYSRLAPSKQAVAFCCSIEHSMAVAHQFHQSGIVAEHVDGQMNHGERDAIIERFTSGQTKVLCNAALLGEGFDVPAIEAVILLRPTASLSLHLQQIGRALRPAPGKPHAVILDHAGNAERHGLPDDDREWSLDDRPKKKRGEKSEVSIKQCPDCYRVHAPAPACPQCGHTYAVVGREVENVEGELIEVDMEMVRARKRQELKSAKTLDDLVALGRQRGYRNPIVWASHRLRERAEWRRQA
jgi:DNA repair protein RadD